MNWAFTERVITLIGTGKFPTRRDAEREAALQLERERNSRERANREKPVAATWIEPSASEVVGWLTCCPANYGRVPPQKIFISQAVENASGIAAKYPETFEVYCMSNASETEISPDLMKLAEDVFAAKLRDRLRYNLVMRGCVSPKVAAESNARRLMVAVNAGLAVSFQRTSDSPCFPRHR